MTPVWVNERLRPATPWIIFLLVALAWHVALFALRFQFPDHPLPARVEVTRIDPRQLEAIRRRNAEIEKRNSAQKPILLNKDKSIPNEPEAPDNARYMSDRNHTVQKESRSKEHDILPKPGSPGSDRQTEQARRAPTPPQLAERPKTETPRETRPENKTPSRRFGKLGNLGLPFRLNEKTPAPVTPSRPQIPAQQTRAGQAGSEQYISDPNLPEGSENLLNTEQSVYYSFYARLYEAIGPVWQSQIREVPYRRTVQQGDYRTEVDAIFDGEGNLIGVEQSASSGIPEFDAAVQSAWRRIGRFPNPPKGLLNSRGEVHTGWTFTVQVGAGFNLDSLPPERNY